MKDRILKLWKDCKGQDLVEYALAAGMAAVAALPALSATVKNDSTSRLDHRQG